MQEHGPNALGTAVVVGAVGAAAAALGTREGGFRGAALAPEPELKYREAAAQYGRSFSYRTMLEVWIVEILFVMMGPFSLPFVYALYGARGTVCAGFVPGRFNCGESNYRIVVIQYACWLLGAFLPFLDLLDGWLGLGLGLSTPGLFSFIYDHMVWFGLIAARATLIAIKYGWSPRERVLSIRRFGRTAANMNAETMIPFSMSAPSFMLLDQLEVSFLQCRQEQPEADFVVVSPPDKREVEGLLDEARRSREVHMVQARPAERVRGARAVAPAPASVPASAPASAPALVPALGEAGGKPPAEGSGQRVLDDFTLSPDPLSLSNVSSKVRRRRSSLYRVEPVLAAAAAGAAETAGSAAGAEVAATAAHAPAAKVARPGAAAPSAGAAAPDGPASAAAGDAEPWPAYEAGGFVVPVRSLLFFVALRAFKGINSSTLMLRAKRTCILMFVGESALLYSRLQRQTAWRPLDVPIMVSFALARIASLLNVNMFLAASATHFIRLAMALEMHLAMLLPPAAFEQRLATLAEDPLKAAILRATRVELDIYYVPNLAAWTHSFYILRSECGARPADQPEPSLVPLAPDDASANTRTSPRPSIHLVLISYVAPLAQSLARHRAAPQALARSSPRASGRSSRSTSPSASCSCSAP